ncbi:MAG TPA: potassium transporter Kup [Methylophilaceae bacterium]|nr:potassium transporter Kup [Methylophilaceae bacterium]
MESANVSKSRLSALSLAALGVVYGDIGTSPIYAIQAVFTDPHHTVPIDPANVLGVLSLILWALILVVTIKYVTFVMRANNRGEGGIMALIALASAGSPREARKQKFIMLIGILGACMFYADGMITPAISVLSAIEGLKVAAPRLEQFVIPTTLVVLFLLFWFQSKGTGLMGKLFGPIMLVWFASLAALGISGIIREPAVLQAINPIHALHFFENNHWLGFAALGAVVLAVTGTEALYADMGHFGRKPIAMAWLFLVLPALLLNYFGQGALILHDPATVKNPFYMLVPSPLLYPMIVLATLATVIASQAVISGAYSISRQALQLGYLPRMQVQHTSEMEAGQIYMPRVNWSLMVAVMLLVVGFGSSSNLAAAYGVAVTGNMLFTTLLAAIVFHNVWGWSKLRTGLLISLFLVVDLAFFGANLLKIPAGGWFPLLIGVVLYIVMSSWKTGRKLLYERLKQEAMALEPFIEAIGNHPPARVPGTAIFMTPNPHGVPHALLHNLKHNKVLHEKVVLLTVKIEDYPHTQPEDRVEVEILPNEFYRILVRYGFKDDPDLPRELEACAAKGIGLDPMDVSFFIGKEALIPTRNSDMAYWREKIFVAMFRNADSVTNHFKLPPNRVVELGAQVTL